MKDTRRVDFWTGIVLIALAAGVWAMTADLPSVTRGIGPGAYPRVIAVFLFILGTIMAIKNIKDGYPAKGEKVDWRKFSRTIILVVGTFIYVKLLKIVGFPILTPFFLFGVMKLFGYESNIKGAIISLVFAEVIFFLFYKVFMIFLPMGFLG
ncbi:MAG: tripartite tricarboxylate transporter TctB family protein [Spirochaetales bacterium]|nr:tripartite tricarboxylate transporter TctB family protein [Spirochaetales bacterium]